MKGEEGEDFNIAGGIIHTIEFPSELVAVLKEPSSQTGGIHRLSLTALGANGSFHCAFDEGRTVFIAESQHGQLSRLVKVRIGRVAVVWNKARHVIVYERTTVPSVQFEYEQEYDKTNSRGWPILRKTEEYIEPIEVLRPFEAEIQKDLNHAAFIESSEIISPRIYVNGSWGRDLGHGYEIPLWNPNDTSGLYPQPELALRGKAGDGSCSRLWGCEPHQRYFYSNTERNTGADPDRWEAKSGVDCPAALHRLQNCYKDVEAKDLINENFRPSPRSNSLCRPRFDFRVKPEGKINLQHGRGETEMLVDLEIVSLMRSDSQHTSDLEGSEKTDWDEIVKRVNQSDKISSLGEIEVRLRSEVQRAFERMRSAPDQCKKIKCDLKSIIRKNFKKTGDRLKTLASQQNVDLPKLSTLAVKDIKEQITGFEAALRVPFGLLHQGIASLRAEASSLVDGSDALKSLQEKVISQWQSGVELVIHAFNVADAHFKDIERAFLWIRVAANSSDNGDGYEEVVTVLEGLKESINNIRKEIEKQGLDPLRQALEEAHTQVSRLAENRIFGASAKQVSKSIKTIRQLVDSTDNFSKELLKVLKGEKYSEILQNLQGAIEKIEIDNVTKNLKKALKDTKDAVLDSMDKVTTKLEENNASLSKNLDFALSELEKLAAVGDASLEAIEKTTLGKFRHEVEKICNDMNDKAQVIDQKVALAMDKTCSFISEAANIVEYALNDKGWLKESLQELLKFINKINCDSLDSLVEVETQLRHELQKAGDQIREKMTGFVTELLDEDTRAKLEELEKKVSNLPGVADKVGSGIKLVKALGDLPKLPTLTFNAERAEYFFEDSRKAIETSPFAAKLREVDAGLKELGLVIPTRQLLDQFMPDNLESIEFNKIFKNLGGIDFNNLFKRFRLPQIASDRLKVTHGLDKTTRTLWIRSHVNVDFNEEQSLFELASFALLTSRIKLLATNEVRVSAIGERTSTTDARFTADWALRFSNTVLARFLEVSVSYDGSRVDFDFSPDKLELHPSLKFLNDFTQRLSDKIPPNVEVVKDQRGKQIGARVNVVNEIKPINAGVISIGPMNITSGLSLEVTGSKGECLISTRLNVGSKQEPVWLQIGYLGGGMWVEAKASYGNEKDVTYSASVGLALGTARNFSFAGVARGSFALLLFVYMEIKDSGGSLRAGLSITGSARILGIANASVMLLLEVEHGSGGNSMGRGLLDVKIRISKFYKIHVRREIEKQIGR